MQRRFTGAYVLGAIELLLGSPLVYAGWRNFPELFRPPSPFAPLDDYLGFGAMAITGTATVVAAAVTLFHSRLSYGLLHRARLGAIFADVWMLLAAAGMWMIARQRGGDWAELAVLDALLFLAIGTLLLVLSLITLRYIRRMGPGSTTARIGHPKLS